MLDPDLRELMTQTILIAPAILDAYSRASYGDDVSYACRIEQTDREIHGADGRVHIAGTRAFVDAPPTAVALNDRVTLPDGSHPSLHAIDKVYEVDGTISHLELYLGIAAPRGA